MKNECNIVRDLLPLYIDGAISEDSRKLVEEHTSICEACSKERREMMLALPENKEPQVERNVLKRAAKKLRRKHMIRGGVIVILGLILGVVLLRGASSLNYYLKYDNHVRMALEDYTVRFSALDNGSLVWSMFPTAPGSFARGFESEPTEDGTGTIIRFYATTTYFPRDMTYSYVFRGRKDDQFTLRDGRIYAKLDDAPVAAMYRLGKNGEEELIYQYGEDESLIASASEEMELYYQLMDNVELYYDIYLFLDSIEKHEELRNIDPDLVDYINEEWLPFDNVEWGSEDYAEQLDQYDNQLNELRHCVPEWQ